MQKFTALMLASWAVLGCSSPSATDVVTSDKGLLRIATLDATTHALLFAATDPFVPVTTGVVISVSSAATTVAAAAPTSFLPPGCVTAVATGGQVAYTLNSCATPLGVIGVSGSYVVNYTQVAGGVGVAIASTNLSVNGIPVTVAAQATYTQSGTARTLAINSTGAAPGDEYTIVQSVTSTLSWNQGDTCASENSTGTLAIAGTTVTQTQNGLMRCLNQCPQTSTFVVASGANTLVTLNFNGTVDATFTATGNQSGQITLACTTAP